MIRSIFSRLISMVANLFSGSDDPNLPIAKRVPSDDCLELVRHFESLLDLRSDGYVYAYLDPVKIPTIGWGTIQYPDGRAVRMGDKITVERADELLRWEIEEKAAGVSAMLKVAVTQNEFDALVSFAYNIGLGAVRKSTLLRKLNAGDKQGAANEFRRWTIAGGKVLRGLVRRRESERRLFLNVRPFIVTI